MIFYLITMLIEFRRNMSLEQMLVHVNHIEQRADAFTERLDELIDNLENIIEENRQWMRERGYS